MRTLSPALAALVLLAAPATQAAEDEALAEAMRPATVAEARGRARLLHEAFHGALQVMHRDFFDPDDRHRIPSASLEDVFEAFAKTWNITFTWLGVNARTMDLDHEPQDDFEKNAVAAIASGKEEFEAVEGDRYRYAGLIPLHNRCLKCHVPNRTSLEDRAAALAIAMPFGQPAKP